MGSAARGGGGKRVHCNYSAPKNLCYPQTWRNTGGPGVGGSPAVDQRLTGNLQTKGSPHVTARTRELHLHALDTQLLPLTVHLVRYMRFAPWSLWHAATSCTYHCM